MSDPRTIFLSPQHFKEVLEHLRNRKKIHAIKITRNHAICRDSPGTEKVGLKEAKLAVERLDAERLGGTGNVSSQAARIICGPKVHKVVLDYGDEGGPVELDVEGMHFVNGCSWAHILRETATLLGINEENILSDEECQALNGTRSPDGVITKTNNKES